MYLTLPPKRSHCVPTVFFTATNFNYYYWPRLQNGSLCWTRYILLSERHKYVHNTLLIIFSSIFNLKRLFCASKRSTNFKIGHDRATRFTWIILITRDSRTYSTPTNVTYYCFRNVNYCLGYYVLYLMVSARDSMATRPNV